MARLHSPNWMEQLPWVMLGLKTVPKEDIGTSVAELVYGEPLTIPGELIAATATPFCATEQLNDFRGQAQSFLPTPTSRHCQPPNKVPSTLTIAKYVFVRCDASQRPLQRPYTGPYVVAARNSKTFDILMGNRTETISIDRLKPAHVETSQPVLIAHPPKRGRPRIITTNNPAPPPPPSSSQQPHLTASKSSRSGRQLRPPRRFM
ncbi:uncharacterized protein LOC101846463 [Aplysia californica]|uniref:Uncharacterized protein LOC101846463 n=1 Tax=Aplysia californica TaxID=6500 RepID=A0ABM0K539_APLCA|nr:uncharacterized protein LOC101846463 [Aplysia californica]